MPRDTYIGFDSAWTNKPSAPGAICAMSMEDGKVAEFHEPRLATFEQALDFIDAVKSRDGATLVALDQPTIVPNLTSMRPVERVAASVISWLGGGVQPANRGKVGMFCDASPIWPFLAMLDAAQEPEHARSARSGLHLIEVFPALALPSFNPEFFGRLAAPRYNPARRKTFRPADWERVSNAAVNEFMRFGADAAVHWCMGEASRTKPMKSDQDRLDAMLCLLVALRWRLMPRQESMMLGCLDDGYMVFPASDAVRERIMIAADRVGISAQ